MEGGRSEAELAANRPTYPIRPPNRSRHALDGINRRTRPDDRNSVVLPWVDMDRDTEQIRVGHAERLPDNRFRINGRTYFVKGIGQGTLVPEDGHGVVVLGRAEMRALITLVKYGGFAGQAERELQSDPNITEADIRSARRLFAQRTKRP
jgi:hypothetical protein